MSLHPRRGVCDILRSLGVRSSGVTPSASRSRGGAEGCGGWQADLAPNEIGDVQRLFDGKFSASSLPYARVRDLVKLYATHYNHAVPFDDDVLDDIWSRCHDLRCGTTRRKVERMLEEGSWEDLSPEPELEWGLTVRSPVCEDRTSMPAEAPSVENPRESRAAEAAVCGVGTHARALRERLLHAAGLGLAQLRDLARVRRRERQPARQRHLEAAARRLRAAAVGSGHRRSAPGLRGAAQTGAGGRHGWQ